MSLALLGVSLVAGGCSGGHGRDGDAGVDAGDGDGDGSGGRGQRPRSDAGQTGDPIVTCNPYQQDACPAGQKCALLARRPAGAQNFTVQNGCVSVDKERPPGAPCVSFDVSYSFEGLAEEILLDPCEQGHVCAADPRIPGLQSCQPACQSGGYAGFGRVACEDPGSYCTGEVPAPSGNAYLEWCQYPDACDATEAGVCGEGRGCFLRFNDTFEYLLSDCYPLVAEPTADYAPCEFINECAAGSLCWGPVDVPIDSWQVSEQQCRPTCVPGLVADEDAGTDDDAGMDDAGLPDGGLPGPDGCPAGTVCRPFSDGPVADSELPGPLGQCE